MLDITYIRENRQKVADSALNKGVEVDVDGLLSLDDNRRKLIKKADDFRQRKNELAGKSKGGKPSQEDIEKGKSIRNELSKVEAELKVVVTDYENLIKQIPNVSTDDTPIGDSEEKNEVVFEWGEKPKFEFNPKNHWEIAEPKGWIDKERATKVAGARFAYIKGDLALLHLSLVRYGFDVLTNEKILEEIIQENKIDVPNKVFTPVLPPLLIKTEPYDAMDRLEPREERYKLEGEELWLQGSAEHVLGSMHADEIFEEKELPVRYVGYATSFRREAGSYGKDMEGIFRMHQFDKLEMESFSRPEDSLNEHYLMIAIQEYLMRQLELPHRKLLKCTADIGKPNARGVDLDVWLPGQNKYRETHTADYMTDYQARRLQTRFRRQKSDELELIHTNDATVFSQRPLIAIIENNQTVDGDVVVPKVLQSYMSNKEII